METDPNAPCAVETMEDGAFASYLSGRVATVAGLSSGMQEYDGKRALLTKAVGIEKDAAEMLRSFSRVTVTQGAAGEDITLERRLARLVRLRQNLFAARSNLSFTESKFMVNYSTTVSVIENFCSFHQVWLPGSV